MKLELRETCIRFKESLIKEFDERLKELKAKDNTQYNRERSKVNLRYHDWILGYADELGNRYTTRDQRVENRDKVKKMLIDHMVRLTNNQALGIWLEKADSHTWEKIIGSMFELDKVHYSCVLYRFTYAAICQYLYTWKQIFTLNCGAEEGCELYKYLETQLVGCLKVKKCTYWSTIDK